MFIYSNLPFSYYFKVVATKSGGKLTLAVNGKMFNTSLTESDSSYVLNEIQAIEISSVIIPEAYVIKLSKFNINFIFFINLFKRAFQTPTLMQQTTQHKFKEKYKVF